ncbi:hypothetical protein ACS127_00975 [Amphibacillus sp. Q70]|uniref:hypothetical protein n=1 Tax=Amphibacillus sp. Q70 TaxID=3453416 RepID=UPI003F865D02
MGSCSNRLHTKGINPKNSVIDIAVFGDKFAEDSVGDTLMLRGKSEELNLDHLKSVLFIDQTYLDER